MKRKLLISGILGTLLIFGILLFTACPIDDDSSSAWEDDGNANGDGNSNGDGNANGDGNGNDNENNAGGAGEAGVYIGIISFAGTADDLTNGDPVLLDASGKSSLVNKLSANYTISSQGGTALFYAVHKALANLTSRENQAPPKLDSVNVITFTDGLDNGSTGMSAMNPIEGKTFDSDNAYTTYLNEQITSRTIAGKSITAYSIGVKGSDVSDTTKFQNDLAKIASAGKSQSLTDFGTLQSTFQNIANNLQVTHTSTTFTMKTTLLASGTKVRMTFDVTSTTPSDAAGSSKYIEGTITRTGTGASMVYTFSDISYAGGLGSSQGSGPITGTINGSEVNFAFTGVAGYTPSTDESKAKQWLMAPDAAAWQVNSEYNVGGATNTQVEKRSAIIYLVLDSSKSLNTTQIGQIRTAVTTFINSLYSQITSASSGGSGDGYTGDDDYGDHGDNSGSDGGYTDDDYSGGHDGDGGYSEPSLPPYNAFTLSSSSSWRTGDSISPSFPEMWYRVSVPSSNAYYLSARDRSYTSASYTADIVFEIYQISGSGFTKLGPFDAGNGSTTYYRLPSSGTYYIRVVPKDGNTSNYGSYAMYFY
jgi:hypothetical protein